MANKERGEISHVVNGKRYTLRPSFDSLCELDELTGKSLDEMLAAMNEGRLSGLRAAVWSLLNDVHGDEIKTLKDASRWIEDAGGVDVVHDLIEKVFRLNEPDAPAEVTTETPNPPSAQDDGTGARNSEQPVASV